MFTFQAFQLSVAVFCVAAVAGDFVGLSAEQLARAGRQSDDGAVQVRSVIIYIVEMFILYALLEESLLLTKVYLAVRQNVSWLIQSSVTTKIIEIALH